MEEGGEQEEKEGPARAEVVSRPPGKPLPADPGRPCGLSPAPPETVFPLPAPCITSLLEHLFDSSLSH